MTDNAPEITGLQSGIQHCELMEGWFYSATETQDGDHLHLQYMTGELDRHASSSEQSIAALQAGGVKGEAIQFLNQAAEAAKATARRYQTAQDAVAQCAESIQQAMDAYRSACDALKSHIAIAEQYAANPDAGDKDFVTEEPAVHTSDSDEKPADAQPIQLPEDALQVPCTQCGTTLVHNGHLQLNDDRGEALATLVCPNQCGRIGAWRWQLSPDEYAAAAAHQAAVTGQPVTEEEAEEQEEEDDNTCDCDDITCSYDHPEGQSQFETWWTDDKDGTLENNTSVEWVVADLTDNIYGRWPKAEAVRRGSMMVRDRFTGEKWEALAFLAKHVHLQQQYLKHGLHAFWPDEYKPGLGYVPNPNWAD